MVVVSSSFKPPAEGILLELPSTKLLVNDEELGTANLYITQQNVVWGGGVLSAGGLAPTISLQYPTISLHAIQREPSAALYMVLNYELRLAQLGNMEAGDGDSDDDNEFDPEETPITQMRFVPPNESDLAAMYAAMSAGQALHPDPQDDEEAYMDGEDLYEGDEEFEEFEDAVESNTLPDDAASRLRQLRLDHANGTHEDNEEDAEVED